MKKTQKNIKGYLKERGWDNLHPADISKSIIIEAAELLEVFQWDNTNENNNIDSVKLDKIKGELADVLIYCFEMAIILDIDAEKIINEKLEKVIKKYPAHLFNKNNSKDKKTIDTYFKIKELHRKSRK